MLTLFHRGYSFTLAICRGYLPQLFAVAICRGNLPQLFVVGSCRGTLLWLFAVGICRGYLPWEFTVAICCGNLLWLIAARICCACLQSVFCICKQILFGICKQILFIWKQTFFRWSKSFLFMKCSLLKVFLFVIVVAVMGHGKKLLICYQFNCKHFLIVSNVDIIWFNLKAPEQFSCWLGASFSWNQFKSKSFVWLF